MVEGFRSCFLMCAVKGFFGGKIPPAGHITLASVWNLTCIWANVSVHPIDAWVVLTRFTSSVAVIWWRSLLHFRDKCDQSLHSFTDRWWMLQCQPWLTCPPLKSRGIWWSMWALGLGKPLSRSSTSSGSVAGFHNVASRLPVGSSGYGVTSAVVDAKTFGCFGWTLNQVSCVSWFTCAPRSGHWKMLTANIPARQCVFSASFDFYLQNFI